MPFDFFEIGQAIFETCLARMASIGYQDGKEISHATTASASPNACAAALSHDPVRHKIVINGGLMKELHQVARAFADTRLHPRASQAMSARHALHQIAFKHGTRDVDAIVYRLALAFVYFHEAGHLNQQHAKFRDSLEDAACDVPFDELDAGAGESSICGIESTLRQTLELMADYEGVVRTLELVKAVSIDPQGKPARDTTGLVWLAIVAICLAFYIFQGRHPPRALMPMQGVHPPPAARMLMIARWIADHVERDPEVFAGFVDADRRAEIIEEALISAGQFWYSHTASDDAAHVAGLPVLHAEMKPSADFEAWQSQIALAWQLVAPRLQAQRVCEGVPLRPMFFRFTRPGPNPQPV